jgi:probable F420-dependent oxidoreductase
VTSAARPRGEDLQVVTPFWLDRPDSEAVDIALAARRCGFGTLWIGEMATFDAFALATAVGLKAPGLRLKIGPLAIGVRSPVALALGLSSVATLTGAHADLALGASSPAIVRGWHDRPWAAAAPRMLETVQALRPILAGEKSAFEGEHVRVRGFRLRQPQPHARISVAAFGPHMTRVAAVGADEVVLNLVTPERVARVRAIVDEQAQAHGRVPPPIVTWVSVALEPGAATHAQLAAQIAAYLAPPGYGETFIELGHEELVRQARAGTRRSELASAVPVELLRQVCAIGSREQIEARLSAYLAAGATHVGIVPATAEDPAGRRVLEALGPTRTAAEG